MSSIAAGTTTTTGYVVTSDSTGALVLKTGSSATTAMTIDTSQNVGIGTGSPSRKLVVSNAGAQGFEFGAGVGLSSGNEILNYNRSTSLYVASTSYASTHTFYTGTSGATLGLVLDASGKLIINGTTSNGYLTIKNTNPATSLISIQSYASTTENVNFKWDQSTDIFSINTNNVGGGIVFGTGASGTERVRITSAGNFGIGATSPVTLLELKSATPIITLSPSAYTNQYQTTLGTRSGAEAYLIFGNNNVNEIRAGRTAAGGFLNFYTNNTVDQTSASDGVLAMQLASSGNVGIGVSPQSISRLDVIAVGSAESNAGLQVRSYLAGTSDGSTTVTAIRAVNSSAGNWANTRYHAYSHNWGVGGSASTNSSMTLDASGNLLVGANSSYTSYASIQVTGDNKGVGIRDTTDGSYRAIYNQSGTLYFYNGSNEGYLSSGGAWVNASDARLKTNVRDVEYGLSAVMQSKPRSFERVDIEGSYVGFVAQELQELIPEVVSGRPEKQLGVDYGSLVAVAFKAIQEQQAIIQQLQADVAALKGTA